MRAVFLGLMLLGRGVAAGQSGGPSQITFRMERADPQTSYTLQVADDGSVAYGVDFPAKTGPLAGMQQEIRVALGGGTSRKLFEQVRSLGDFSGKCESKAKNIAQTGAKTLTLTGPEHAPIAKCTWNYSENKAVTAVGDEMIGLAYTLDTGKKMMRDQQFDRLALDKDSADLVDAVKAGRAFGIEAIAPILKAIVEDQSLLERVRWRATKLLEQGALSR